MSVATTPWHASAAFLYVLGLRNVDLAWEYLRRNVTYENIGFVAGTEKKIQHDNGSCGFFENQCQLRPQFRRSLGRRNG